MSGTTSTLPPSTPTNRRLAGITVASVNGVVYNVTEFSWSPGTIKRETLLSMSGVDGYSEMPRAPYVAGKFRDAKSASVTSFNGMTNATVVFQLANGKQIVGSGLWNTGEIDVAGIDATFDFKFEGAWGSLQEQGIG
jgi:hypothetical protein